MNELLNDNGKEREEMAEVLKTKVRAKRMEYIISQHISYFVE